MKSHLQIIASHFNFKAGVYLCSWYLDPSQVAFYAIGAKFAEQMMQLPQSLGLAMFPRLAGTASSIAGLAQMGMGAMGTVTVAALSLVGSRYVAMPLVIGLLPFAFAMLLSGRLLRPAGMAR